MGMIVQFMASTAKVGTGRQVEGEGGLSRSSLHMGGGANRKKESFLPIHLPGRRE